jgi:hypothetical protein
LLVFLPLKSKEIIFGVRGHADSDSIFHCRALAGVIRSARLLLSINVSLL